VTREEIRERWPALSARERDALVAEALGWHHFEWRGELAPFAMPEPENELFRRLIGITKLEPVPVPHYSTSWADAGLLLEELARTEVVLLGSRPNASGWGLSVTLGPESRNCSSGPEAVALAFVLAKATEGGRR
jgi:hypothetical protein